MKDRTKRIIRKYYEFVQTKIKLIFFQRKYHHEDVTIKYILKKTVDSKNLVIVFSSCTRKGIKARYNYMRTLDKVSVNKLFILDDFASDHRGSYYLGSNWRFNEERATLALCMQVIEMLKAEKVICCGSSKGGYSALNFGLQIDGSYIVAGGPQYYLYDYLKESGNIECLSHIIGDEIPQKANELNLYLEKRIRNNCFKNQMIYLHFSNLEHTYFEHVKYLICELERNGYTVECDISDYKHHSDISYYYPDFLVNSILKVFS